MPTRAALLIAAGLMSVLLPGRSLANAEPTNGASTLAQDAMSCAGGVLGDGSPISLDAVMGQAYGGISTGSGVTLRMGYQGGRTQNASPAPIVASSSAHTLTGAKPAGASVWINGVEMVAANEATTWSVTVALVEGDNIFIITTRDGAGAEGAATTRTVVLDDLPPVITVTSPTNTNQNPFTLTGTVDDSLTIVRVNGVAAQRSGVFFEASLTLIEGPNELLIEAASPNGHISTTSLTVTLGTVPTLLTILPVDGSKVTAEAPTTIQITAEDGQGDSIECRLLLDGQVLVDWSPTLTHPWTPTVNQIGAHQLQAQVRDGSGGIASQEVDIYVVRMPIRPPE